MAPTNQTAASQLTSIEIGMTGAANTQTVETTRTPHVATEVTGANLQLTAHPSDKESQVTIIVGPFFRLDEEIVQEGITGRNVIHREPLGERILTSFRYA